MNIMQKSTLTLWINEVQSDSAYFVFYDPQAKESNGYLRSYPLLASLIGDNHFSLISKEAGHNCPIPINLLENTKARASLIGTPLLSDEISVIHVDAEEDEKLGYVTDYIETTTPRIFITGEESYVPSKWKITGRNLQDRTQISRQKFEKVYSSFLAQNELTDYQLAETKNIAFLYLAKIHHQLTGERVHHLAELFDYENPNLAASPIWDLALRIIKLREENRVSDLKAFTFNALRPWIERNMYVDVVAERILQMMDTKKKTTEDIQTLRHEKWNMSDYSENTPKLCSIKNLIKPNL